MFIIILIFFTLLKSVFNFLIKGGTILSSVFFVKLNKYSLTRILRLISLRNKSGGINMLIEKKAAASSRLDMRKIVIIGLLSAITVVLSLTPLGFIPIPPINPTIMHIPVIIGAILEGPFVGAMLGLVFGVTSMFKALTQPTIVTFPFLNPLVSVLPRIIIGITSYYSYKILKFKSQSLRIGIGVFVGSITNTVLVLGAIYIIYLDRYASAIGLSTSATGLALLGVIFTNGLPEAVISILICVPVIQMLKKIRK